MKKKPRHIEVFLANGNYLYNKPTSFYNTKIASSQIQNLHNVTNANFSNRIKDLDQEDAPSLWERIKRVFKL